MVSLYGSAKCIHFVCVTAGYSFEHLKLSRVSTSSCFSRPRAAVHMAAGMLRITLAFNFELLLTAEAEK